MFDKEKIVELTNKGLLEENNLKLERYVIIGDEDIKVDFLNLEIKLWSNGDITFRDILNMNCYGDFINNKVLGKGSRIYNAEIKEAINKFKLKYNHILEQIE